jgi:RHS repeat-associated core domain protein
MKIDYHKLLTGAFLLICCCNIKINAKSGLSTSLNLSQMVVQSQRDLVEKDSSLISENPLLPKIDDSLIKEISIDNENYIFSRTMLTEDSKVYMDKIEYFDGLGRPKETIFDKASPSKQKIVTYQEYDDMGRVNRKWSSVPIKSWNSKLFDELSLSETSPFMFNMYVSRIFSELSSVKDASNTFYKDNKAYTETQYESSPLNRVLKQFGVGQAWQNADRAVKIEYMLNTTSGDLACTDFGVLFNDYFLINYGLYSNSKLYVTKVTDEDNRTTYEFKDKLGQVVLKRVMNGNEKQDTYFVYDDFGRLRYVLPPVAVDLLGSQENVLRVSQQLLDDNAYYYQYDGHGNCILKKLPGCEPVKMVYDRADRLVLSQDGNQRAKKQWLVTKYDIFGRIAYTGMMNDAGKNYQELLKDKLVVENYISGTSNTGYTENTYDGIFGAISPLIVNYYDKYDFYKDDLLNYVNKAGYGERYANTNGLLTGMRTYMLDDGNYFNTTTLFYDDKGRVIQTRSTNNLNGYDVAYHNLDFTGKVRNTLKTHSYLLKNKFTTPIGIYRNLYSVNFELYSYNYDHAGRLLTVQHKLNDNAPVVIAENKYDEIGRLQMRKTPVETTNYAYNVRGWLTQAVGNKFKETLTYNEAIDDVTPSIPCYSGNISAMKWQVEGEPAERGYQFSYDGIGRLSKALYGEGKGIVLNNKYDELIDYDKVGNITTLQRYGKSDNGFGLIDNLSYVYNNNQLMKVTDTADSSVTYYGAFHFVDGADAETEYVYDANGNMTQDFNKKISKIEYNSLNLPSMIQYSHGYQAHYGYDAAGRKLSVRHIISPVNIYVPMGSTTLPENAFLEWRGFDVYADNIQYFMEKSLSVFPTRLNFDGGYITSIDDTPVYHYYLQDHLGNNRMVVNTNGEVEQVNHYYAFGGLMGESTGGDTQTYKYNGKELDCINGLDWYDYGARNYDAALGRWHVVDPLAEKYYNVSPYAYGGNNPVNRVDFYGMFPTKYAALDYAKAQNVDFRNVGYANDRKEWYVSFGEDGKGYKSGGTLERRFSERLVDTKEWSTIGNFNSGIGTGASLIDFNFGKALKRSTAYVFYDKTGRYLSSIRPSVKFNNISYEFNPKVISRIAKTAKIVGRISGAVSIGMTGYEIYEKKKNIIGEGGLDLIMTGAGFIPPYGWVVSGAYFLGKYGMEELNIDFWNK